MRLHLVLLSLLLVALGVFADLALTLNGKNLLFLQGQKDSFANYMSRYQQKHAPETEINFTALYGGHEKYQVLHPLLDFQKLDIRAVSPTCEREETANADKSDRLPQDRRLVIPAYRRAGDRKENLFNRFMNEGGELPANFIATPPYLHRSGISYAYFLAAWDYPPYNNKAWVEAHLSYFKASELKEILKKYGIYQRQYEIIGDLTASEMKEVVQAANVVLTKNLVLIKSHSQFGFSPLTYKVYDLKRVRDHLKESKYDLHGYLAGDFCLQRLGDMCWTYNSRQALSYLYRYSLAAMGLAGLIFFALLGIYLNYLWRKANEQRQQRLALQVLSHEFRTPVSALLLQLEALGTATARLNTQEQDAITRLSAEIFRLQRILEVSRTYLQAEGGAIPFQNVELPSLNQWIATFADNWPKPLRLELLEKDRSVRADPFWLNFVLSNLVQNAFDHGAEPVTVRLRARAQGVDLTVEDHGRCEFGSFSQMSAAFVKNQRSQGMGLGLNIVKFVVRQWGSEVRFSPSPTSFTVGI